MLSLLTGALSVGVAAELASRAWIRRRREYFVLPPGQRLHMRLDHETFPELDPVTRFEVNADGERGGDVPAGPGVYRVLVAGGSQAECHFIDQDRSFSAELQEQLDAPDFLRLAGASKVHVGSIARSGVGAEGLDLILERVLPRYRRIQLLVVAVGATDVLRWLELGTPAMLPPVRAADLFRCHPDVAFGWTPYSMASVEQLRRQTRRHLRPIEKHPQAGRWVGDARRMRRHAREIRTTTPNPAVMLDHFEFYLRRALFRARTRADRVIVVRQPWFEPPYAPEVAAHMWHGGVGQIWRDRVDTFYSDEVCAHLMSLVDARAAEVADACGIEHVDVMSSIDQSLSCFYDFAHFTPAGARAMATAVSATVVSGASPRRPASIEDHRAPVRPAGQGVRLPVNSESESEPCAGSRAS